MKVANLNIPTSAKNDPTKIPSFTEGRTTSLGYAIRDPYILLYGDKYYMYHSLGKAGIGCSVSENLENWSDSVTVFETPEDFHGIDCFFWAPECHYYKGNFYIFTSVKSKAYNDHRVISVYRADNPLGPFVDIANGCISPADWDAIDGTLYVDDEGQPWMVFVHEWTSYADKNGGMCAAKLSEDFTHFVSEPIELFRAKDTAWATHGVTDGPYLYTTDAGKLLMIWSNFSEKGYVVALLESESGKVTGPWKHCDKLLYQKDLHPDFETDGGHAMIFVDKNGETRMALHGPNSRKDGGFEHLQLFRVIEDGGLIRLEK